MDRVKAIWEKLKKGGSLGFAVIVVVFGIMLLLLPGGDKTKNDAPDAPAPPEPTAFPLADTENRIAAALSEIDGAGRVTVVLTLRSDGETYIATNKKYSAKGENSATEQSEDAVIVGSGGSNQSPVVVKRGYPEYQGALVVAEGAGDPEVRLALMGAVASLTGLGADRVTVTKMKNVNPNS
ncbi:MAG: hypothetical protein LBN99_02010 [Oscillospiraceae bacterium]|jgi:stage III sporulation protein AG|nr:hypothetical protein [Oscillospiraceae bacterium]